MKLALALLALLTSACATKPQPQTPVGDSMIAGPFVATLVMAMEFRIPEVPARPENDRYRLSLVLHSLDGKTRRTVPVKSGLRGSDFLHTARMMEDDGERLYFQAHEPLAYNYSTGNLSIAKAPHSRPPYRPAPKDFRGAAGDLCRECKRPAVLLGSPNGSPLRLSNPDSQLVLHRSARGVFGTEQLSRIPAAGTPVWTADTGLLDVDQILPLVSHTVFIGREAPVKPDAFRPSVLVIVNNLDGSSSTHPL